MEHRSRTRLVTAVMLAVVFASGVLLGLAADSNLGAEPPQIASANADGEERDGKRRRRTAMHEQVGPSEDQKVVIDSILKDHRARMDALHGEFRSAYDPRYQALIQDTRGAIKEVFSEEQAAEYQALLDDFDRRKVERNEKDDRD